MARPGGIAALALLAAVPAQAGETDTSKGAASPVREFGDWSVACDNARECTAVSLSRAYVKRIEGTDPGDYASPKLWIRRAAAAHALPRLVVDTSVWGEVRPLGRLSLHVYQECDGDCTGRGYRITEGQPGRYELAPPQVAGFLADSTRTSRAATRRADGSMHGIITTSGLAAALLYIDEVQGRAGTVTALSPHARGAKPASAVPPEPVRAVVKAVPGEEEPLTSERDYTALNRQRAVHCPLFGSAASAPEPQRYRLISGQALWSIACGANPHFEERLWLIETGRDRFEAVPLPRPDQGLAAQRPVLPNSDFDAETGQLTGFAGKTCGWRRSWVWTGTAFAMIDAVELPACLDLLPGRWLQTYRAVPL